MNAQRLNADVNVDMGVGVCESYNVVQDVRSRRFVDGEACKLDLVEMLDPMVLGLCCLGVTSCLLLQHVKEPEVAAEEIELRFQSMCPHPDLLRDILKLIEVVNLLRRSSVFDGRENELCVSQAQSQFYSLGHQGIFVYCVSNFRWQVEKTWSMVN